MNLKEFERYIGNLERNYENRDLEEFLLALYTLVHEHKQLEPTFELLSLLIAEALRAEPAPFNPEWLTITQPPEWNFREDELSSEDLKSEEIKFLISVLEFQIAELHIMRGKQLDNEMRYFGVDSDRGNRWFNFDPSTNLLQGLVAIGPEGREPQPEASWMLLGLILEVGRIYE
ncbi:MAG: hypothetical protein ACJ75J_03155 [Cytophagaceae bacterium]